MLATDKLLHDLGENGWFQWRTIIVLNAFNIFFGACAVISTFQAIHVPFYCTPVNYTVSEDFNLENSTVLSKCEYTINNETTGRCLSDESQVHWMEPRVKSLSAEWDLICEDSIWAGHAGSVVMVGVFVGAFVASPVADRWGRRPILLLMVAISTPLAICTTFASSIWVFLICRFTVGVAYSAIGIVTWVMSCEVAPINKRNMVALTGSLFWSGAIALLGPLAYLVQNWRHLQLVISVPSVLCAGYYWYAPESLHWLSAHGKIEEATKIVKMAAKVNKKTINIDEYRITETEIDNANDFEKSKWEQFAKFFTDPILFIHTMIATYAWFVCAFLYYSLSMFSVNLAGNKYVNFTLTAIVEIPANITCAYLIERFGRKATIVFAYLCCSVALLLGAFIPSNVMPTWLSTTLYLIAKFNITLCFTAVWLFATEVYPTTVRSVGVGFSIIVSRLGSILAPYVGYVDRISPMLPPVIFVAFAATAGLLVILLPEAQGEILPETVADIYASDLLARIIRTKRTKANFLAKRSKTIDESTEMMNET